MLKGKLLHPEILGALAGAGHGSKVLITDGNFPHSTKAGSQAQLVYLNLAPGKVLVTEVLQSILTVIPVESFEVMQPADGKDAPHFMMPQSIRMSACSLRQAISACMPISC